MLNKLIRKVFLTKEIISKEGEVFFRRYRLLSTPVCNIYVHNLLKSDQDLEPHTHPWNFISLILKGGYIEDYVVGPHHKNTCHDYIESYRNIVKAGDFVMHSYSDAHKIQLTDDNVWTAVFTWGTKEPWGYVYSDGTYIDHKEYRRIKNVFYNM